MYVGMCVHGCDELHYEYKIRTVKIRCVLCSWLGCVSACSAGNNNPVTSCALKREKLFNFYPQTACGAFKPRVRVQKKVQKEPETRLPVSHDPLNPPLESLLVPLH